MRGRGFFRLLGVLAFGCAGACSLLVDTSGIDGGCPSGQKYCAGNCVPVSDPAYGCKTSTCDPCRTDNGIPRCDGSECVWDTCLYGFGCEKCTAKVLIDENNCGYCGHECRSGECAAGDCVPVGGAGGEAGAAGVKGTSDSTATRH
jgi:hypothetical protein